MIDPDDDTPEIATHAAAARRALLTLFGAAPEDGAAPAGTRFAHDLGMLTAIIDGWKGGLSPTGQALADIVRRDTAALLGTG